MTPQTASEKACYDLMCELIRKRKEMFLMHNIDPKVFRCARSFGDSTLPGNFFEADSWDALADKIRIAIEDCNSKNTNSSPELITKNVVK